MSNSMRVGCLVVLGLIAFVVARPMFSGGNQAEQTGASPTQLIMARPKPHPPPPRTPRRMRQ